ncbi:hypothetical protein JYT25_00815 [bacterium AH-315-C20]|nr:hypothetical protein [bacterium AH-315-C20]
MKVLSKIPAFLIVFGLPFFGVGQGNLVPNPSFEDSITCPTAQDQIYNTENWYSPTFGSPDYFHECHSASLAGVPQNGFGWQYARTGEAYAGGHASAFTGTDVREYIQAQLISSLEADGLYEVSFYVSHTDSSVRACDNIGAYLSEDPVSATDAKNLPFVPQVVSPVGVPITDKVGWVQIADTIVADGTEAYITIGIFTDDASTNWTLVAGGWEQAAHYYIDDVSVTKIGTLSADNMAQDQIKIYFVQATRSIRIKASSGVLDYALYSPTGVLIEAQNFTNPGAQLSESCTITK